MPSGYQGMVFISHISYQSRQLPADYLRTHTLIRLSPQANQLQEVVIVAGENPALQIIRKATANKDQHNPFRLQSFQYTSFNKVVIKFEGPQLNMDSIVRQAQEKPLAPSDSLLLELDSLRNRQHLLVTESVAKKYFKKPDKHIERLLDYRISGFKTPLLAGLPNHYQPLGFYEDWVRILNKDHISPLTRGSEKIYDFELRDTIYYGSDSVYVIAFAPSAGTTANTLQGQLAISTNGYALKNVIARSADPFGKIDFRIQQNYEVVKGQWFPAQLNTELYFKEYKSRHLYPAALARSYLQDIVINEPISDKVFGDVQVDMAYAGDTTLLNRYRMESRDLQEQRTYAWYDSINQKISVFRTLDKLAEGFFSNAFVTGKIDWKLNRLMRFNQYEGVRLGIGLATNPRFSRWVEAGGYAGYGFRDEAWKYGGHLQFMLQPRMSWALTFRYDNDIFEPGVSRFFEEQRTLNNYVFRQWAGFRFDAIERYRASTSRKLGTSWRTSLAVDRASISPAYTYALIVNAEPQSNFTVTEFIAEVNYIHNLREIGFAGRKALYQFEQPLLVARISSAVDNLWGSDFNYIRYELFASNQIRFRRLGRTQISVTAGLTNGTAPLQKLFFAPGSNQTNYWTDHTLQTMGIYEFLNDRYTAAFWKHTFMWFYQSKFSKPELLLWQAAAWGALTNVDEHTGIQFKTMEQGFAESGLGINNLLRFNYLDVAYFGLGGGVFYRWGAYQLTETSDNFAFKLSMVFTF